ncbi:MAG: restriction endonuclease subunit S [Bacteroidales bacterium]|nr:restriction endonuclease subunit S [Bacteroidales bacterium]
MKAETLKKAILQYAMQGKLVEQDPNDEPASILLERIKTEKEQLIKDGKIKKEKPLPPITEDEIPYELPKGWEWVRFNDATLYSTDYVANGSFASLRNNVNTYKTENYAILVKTQDFSTNFSTNLTYIDKSSYEYLSKSKLYGGELMLSNIGASIGKVFIIPNLDRPMSIAPNSIIVKCLNPLMTTFFKYIILSSYGQDLLKSFTAGTAMPKFSKTQLRNSIIPLPPLAEQQRIVEKLEQILPLVEEYGKNEEKLSKLNSTLPDKIKQSILQHAVQGKLVPQNPSDEPASVLLNRIKAEKEQLIKDGKIKKEKILPPITEDEIPFQIPNSWEWTKIRNIAFVTKLAGFEYTKYINLQDSGEIPVIRAQNVKPFSLNLANLKYIDTDTSEMLERSALTKPCLLMTFIGAGIGDVAIFDKNSRFHLAPNVAKIEFYNQHNNIDNRYAMYYLLSNYGKQEVFKFLKATAQPSLSMDTIREVMIPLPPLAEQQRIVTKVEELLAIVDKLKKG